MNQNEINIPLMKADDFETIVEINKKALKSSDVQLIAKTAI